MTEQNSPARHPFEPREADLAAANRPPPSELERFLGGSPSSVAVRLLFGLTVQPQSLFTLDFGG